MSMPSLLAAATLVGAASATWTYNQLDATEKTKIQAALNQYGMTSTDPTSIEVADETFVVSGSEPDTVFELVQDTGSYGFTSGFYYTSNQGNYNAQQIFVQSAGSASGDKVIGTTKTVPLTRNTEIGFWIYIPDTQNTFFSQGQYNMVQSGSDQTDHTLVFSEGLKTVVCFEDLQNGGDADYSDVCMGFSASTGGGASGGGDPHFVGFDGSSYDFFGMPDAVFNLISTPVFQVNSHFASMINVADNTPKTLMDTIAFVSEGVELTMDASGTVTINGEKLRSGSNVAINDDISIVYGRHSENLLSQVPSKKAEEWYGKVGHESSHRLVVTAFDVEISVFLVSTPRMPGLQFLDIQVGALPENVADMHGVIGQTAQGSLEERGLYAPVVGTDADYLVRDGIFGTDFAYNLY